MKTDVRATPQRRLPCGAWSLVTAVVSCAVFLFSSPTATALALQPVNAMRPSLPRIPRVGPTSLRDVLPGSYDYRDRADQLGSVRVDEAGRYFLWVTTPDGGALTARLRILTGLRFVLENAHLQISDYYLPVEGRGRIGRSGRTISIVGSARMTSPGWSPINLALDRRIDVDQSSQSRVGTLRFEPSPGVAPPAAQLSRTPFALEVERTGHATIASPASDVLADGTVAGEVRWDGCSIGQGQAFYCRGWYADPDELQQPMPLEVRGNLALGGTYKMGYEPAGLFSPYRAGHWYIEP